MSIFRHLNIPKGTILFIDDGAADVISLLDNQGDLVPNVFVMICCINSTDEMTSLFERLISITEFQHIALFVTKPLYNYSKQIKCIHNFGEFDIVKVIGTSSAELNDDTVNHVTIPGIVTQVNDLLSIVPTFSPIINDLIGIENDDKEYLVAESLNEALENLNIDTFHSFSIGEFSGKVQKILESNREGDSKVAALIIDRNEICTPLFVQNKESLLDKAASKCQVAVLKDKSFIDIEIKNGINGLLQEIAKLFNINNNFNYFSLEKKWKNMNEEERFQLARIHPSLPYIFSEQNIQLVQLEDSLLQGADFDDLLITVQNDLRKCLPFIGFRNLISPIKYIDETIIDAFSECDEGKSDVASEDDLHTIFSCCQSGVNLNPTNQNTMSSLYALPHILQGILLKNKEIDSRIQVPHSGFLGKMFGTSKYSLKDFQTVYVIILGGISFYELSLIQTIIKKSDTNVKLHFISDSICSSHKVILK